jgi:hypothetical protein
MFTSRFFHGRFGRLASGLAELLLCFAALVAGVVAVRRRRRTARPRPAAPHHPGRRPLFHLPETATTKYR